MSKPYEKIKGEFFALLPPTIFFFFTLGLVAVLRVPMLKGTGIPVSTPVAIQITLFVLIFDYCVMREIAVPLGRRSCEKYFSDGRRSALFD